MADDTPAPIPPSMPSNPAPALNFKLVSRIVEELEPLSIEDRRHVLQTVATWLRLPADTGHGAPPAAPSVTNISVRTHREDEEKFSNRAVQSPKDFLFEKAPTTESERVACLAYYLTHFLDTPHFRNIEISNLNTDAAQRKLTNPGVAVSNAMRDGFLVAAPKAGHKQLSAMGERFVQLLPDRTAANEVRQRMAARRSKRKSSGDTESES